MRLPIRLHKTSHSHREIKKNPQPYITNINVKSGARFIASIPMESYIISNNFSCKSCVQYMCIILFKKCAFLWKFIKFLIFAILNVSLLFIIPEISLLIYILYNALMHMINIKNYLFYIIIYILFHVFYFYLSLVKFIDKTESNQYCEKSWDVT